MNLKGVYIFRTDSGVTLFSKKSIDLNEDFLSAFLAALREFFNSFSLGGLSTFGTDQFIFYIASTNNVTTALIIDQDDKSDKYFNLAFKICIQFYLHYNKYVESPTALLIPNIEYFGSDLEKIINDFSKEPERQQELIKLFKLSKSEDLECFDFINESQLFNIPLFLAVNNVTKRIFVIENPELGVQNRALYLVNKLATSYNQLNFKSEYDIRHISDIWDSERLITQISQILNRESNRL